MAFENRERLLEILQCPSCEGPLDIGDRSIECTCCSQPGAWVDDAVVFFSPELPPDFYNPEYTSSNGYSRASLDLIQEMEGGIVLDFGAGLSSANFPNVVQLEIRKYRGTDVVLATNHLPFKDNSFDGIISQAVIEHVKDPWLHIEEIQRTLKVGGKVVLDAAFLQTSNE